MSAELTPPDPNEMKRAAKSKRARDAESAHSMKMAGATDEDIARVIGYATPRQARMAWQRHMAAAIKEDPEAQARGRALAGQRLERLLRGVWVKAIDESHPEHLTAVTKAQSIIAEHAKLFGLSAPQELVVHTPTKQALEEWVDRITGMGTPDIAEVDIFDTESEWEDEEGVEPVQPEPPEIES